MGVFSRLTDIINSNLNTILDRAEDPEKIIRLIVQEMEDTLVEVRASAAKAIAEKKEVVRSIERLAAAQAEWAPKAELALAKGREDLAKRALVEKSKLADRELLLSVELEHLEQALEQSDGDIGRLEAKLREARAKQKTILARQRSASSRLKVRRQIHDRRVDDALARFATVEKKLDEAEGAVEAYDLGRGKTLADEIDSLEVESAIEEELADLKAKLARASASNESR